MNRKRYSDRFVWEKTKFTCLWYGLAFIVNQKMKSRFYKLWKLWKGDDKLPILQLARFRSKKLNVKETDT